MMKYKCTILVLLALILTAPAAFAEPIYYTINFLATAGIAPTGSFTYDDSGTPKFTSFSLAFNGVNLGAPVWDGTAGSGLPCLGSATGAAAEFALLSGACNFEGMNTIYRVLPWGNPFPGTVGIDVMLFSCVIPTGGCVTLDGTGGSIAMFPDSLGTWTITRVPEPSSLLLLGFGLAGVIAVKSKHLAIRS